MITQASDLIYMKSGKLTNAYLRNRRAFGLLFAVVFPALACIILALIVNPGLFGNHLSGGDSSCVDMFDQPDHTVTFLDVYGNVYKVYTVAHGDCIGEPVEYIEKGYTFIRWDIPSFCDLDISEYPISGDMVIAPVAIEQRLIALNTLAIADPEYASVDADKMAEFIDEIKTEVEDESRK